MRLIVMAIVVITYAVINALIPILGAMIAGFCVGWFVADVTKHCK